MLLISKLIQFIKVSLDNILLIACLPISIINMVNAGSIHFNLLIIVLILFRIDFYCLTMLNLLKMFFFESITRALPCLQTLEILNQSEQEDKTTKISKKSICLLCLYFVNKIFFFYQKYNTN